MAKLAVTFDAIWQFVGALAETLQLKGEKEKLDWAFRVYDANDDGLISLVSLRTQRD